MSFLSIASYYIMSNNNWFYCNSVWISRCWYERCVPDGEDCLQKWWSCSPAWPGQVTTDTVTLASLVTTLHTLHCSHSCHAADRGTLCQVQDKYIRLWMKWVWFQPWQIIVYLKYKLCGVVTSVPLLQCCWSAHVTTTIFPGKLRRCSASISCPSSSSSGDMCQ